MKHRAATSARVSEEPPKKTVTAELVPADEAPGYWPQEADGFAMGLGEYLQKRGLPAYDVLVPLDERRALFRNLDHAMRELKPTARTDAYYVSKFVASTAVGLFDAALNYVWNETILALRKRVADFDLNYFFDSVFSGNKSRDQYNDVEDLKKIEDWQFIQGCRATGIISEHAFTKLDHIREMRNFASAAHPNQAQLTGLDLASYLESCIIHVLSRPPEDGALNNRMLLKNLREGTLIEKDAEPIRLQIDKLPQVFAIPLMRAMFGMYVDPAVQPNVRENIELVGKAAWARVDEETRRHVGYQYGKFSANAETEKKKLARQFLERVEGLNYLTEDMRAIEIKERAEALWNAHVAFNNFYNEEPHAQALARMTAAAEQPIPQVARRDYVRIVTRCFLGNGWGVSNAALPYYKRMIKAWTAGEVIEFARLTSETQMKQIFSDTTRAGRYKVIVKHLLTRKFPPDVMNILNALDASTPKELEVGRAWLNVKDQVEQARY